MIITLPNGKQCTLGKYASAWRTLLTLPPQQDVAGFDWHPSTARDVLSSMRRGMMERINRHDRTRAVHSRDLGPRIFLKMQSAAKRGALRFDCRWCGRDIDTGTYLQPHARFCDVHCQRSFYS